MTEISEMGWGAEVSAGNGILKKIAEVVGYDPSTHKILTNGDIVPISGRLSTMGGKVDSTRLPIGPGCYKIIAQIHDESVGHDGVGDHSE